MRAIRILAVVAALVAAACSGDATGGSPDAGAIVASTSALKQSARFERLGNVQDADRWLPAFKAASAARAKAAAHPAAEDARPVRIDSDGTVSIGDLDLTGVTLEAPPVEDPIPPGGWRRVIPLSQWDENDPLAGIIPPQDNRATVVSPGASPHAPMVFLEVQTAQGVRGCSGTIVGPNTILTAGHCFFQSGAFRSFVRAVPGVKNGSTSLPTLWCKDSAGTKYPTPTYVTPGWINNADPASDVAVVDISACPDRQAVLNQTGTMPAADVSVWSANLAGYTTLAANTTKCPGSTGTTLCQYSGATPSPQPAGNVTSFRTYDGDVSRGQSGGPAWGNIGGSNNVVAGVIAAMILECGFCCQVNACGPSLYNVIAKTSGSNWAWLQYASLDY